MRLDVRRRRPQNIRHDGDDPEGLMLAGISVMQVPCGDANIVSARHVVDGAHQAWAMRGMRAEYAAFMAAAGKTEGPRAIYLRGWSRHCCNRGYDAGQMCRMPPGGSTAVEGRPCPCRSAKGFYANAQSQAARSSRFGIRRSAPPTRRSLCDLSPTDAVASQWASAPYRSSPQDRSTPRVALPALQHGDWAVSRFHRSIARGGPVSGAVACR